MIEEPTPTQFNNALACKQAKAAVHYAITQNECYRAFWNRDPQVILDSMNANIQLTMQRFLGNTALGEAINAQLAHTPYHERCIVTMPSGYAFQDGQFVYLQDEKEINN
jgi:hypothetical protein